MKRAHSRATDAARDAGPWYIPRVSSQGNNAARNDRDRGGSRTFSDRDDDRHHDPGIWPFAGWHRGAERGGRGHVGVLLARQSAILRAAHTGIIIDRPGGHVAVVTGGETLMRRDLEGTYGVALSSTRDSTAYSPLGHGFGAANLSLVIARGRVAETIFVSREGRVRR